MKQLPGTEKVEAVEASHLKCSLGNTWGKPLWVYEQTAQGQE